MAVEILILSGARRHERLVLEANEFRAGSDPACEVFFDPTRDPAAQGRGALVRKEDDGWYISPSGGDLTVNQQVLTGPLRLRSGDVIGLSASGPDFCFRLEARGSEPPAATVPQPAKSVPSAAPVDDSVGSALRGVPGAGENRLPSVATERHGGRSLQGNSSTYSDAIPQQPLSGPSPFTRQWTTWALGGLAAGVLLVVLWRAFQPPVIPPITIHVDAGKPAETVKEKKPVEAGKEQGEAKPAGQEAKKPAEAKLAPVELPREAVFLVEVEKARRFWPFATCVAVAKDTLLTSAREAMQMAAWRQKEGFKLWAVSPALGLRLRLEIHEIRVHSVFSTLADKPSDWIYYDLALLSVEGELPKIAALASAEDLAELKEDDPVRLLGFTHEGEKTPADRKFEPQMLPGSIFVTPVPKEDLLGKPRLLQVEAKIPPNVYGSPIFNARGSVVAIYGAPAVPPDQDVPPAAAAMKDIHYAAIVSAAVVRRWTEDRDENLWVVPTQAAPLDPSPSKGQ